MTQDVDVWVGGVVAGIVVDDGDGAARMALRFIWRGVGSGELVEISLKGGKSRAARGGKWITTACTVQEAVGGGTDGLWFARNMSRGGADAYIGACSLTEVPPPGRRGSGRIRGRAGCLWLDVDVVAPGREAGVFEDAEGALRIVGEAFMALPGVDGAAWRRGALVLGSGWGVQIWLPVVLDKGGLGLEAGVAAAASRGLAIAVNRELQRLGAVGKADRTGDAARVMRMPGTWNWRGGRDAERSTGVIRWPLEQGVGVEVGADGIAWLVEQSRRETGVGRRVGAGTGGAGGAGAGGWGTYGGESGGPVLDVETLADRVLLWSEVLEPYGWTLLDGDRERWGGEVWSRPGREGERSAVAYEDGSNSLVVYSSSAETGFSAGLRRAGGTSAAAGVISKWRAWVDLEWGGDGEKALACVESGSGGEIAAALRRALAAEEEAAVEWAREIEELTQEVQAGSSEAYRRWMAQLREVLG